MEIQQKRWEILKFLRKKGKATIEELAEAIDLAPITVRHHLSVLEKENLIKRSVIRQKVGRPRYVYELTTEGMESFPKRYMTLTERILNKIYHLQGPEMLQKLFEEIGRDLAQETRPLIKKKSFDEKVKILGDILNHEGFVAEVEPDKKGALLKIVSCPFRNIVNKHPSLCFFDRTFIKEFLGVEPVSLKTSEEGSLCIYLIPRKRLR